jgi:hypothetical protein
LFWGKRVYVRGIITPLKVDFAAVQSFLNEYVIVVAQVEGDPEGCGPIRRRDVHPLKEAVFRSGRHLEVDRARASQEVQPGVDFGKMM